MQELKSYEELTLEERKEVTKILSQGRNGMVWASIKFSVGLLTANLISMIVGALLLFDADPSFIVGYQVFSIILNMVFMVKYFNRQMKKNDDTLKEKLKQFLKK